MDASIWNWLLVWCVCVCVYGKTLAANIAQTTSIRRISYMANERMSFYCMFCMLLYACMCVNWSKSIWYLWVCCQPGKTWKSINYFLLPINCDSAICATYIHKYSHSHTSNLCRLAWDMRLRRLHICMKYEWCIHKNTT